MKIRSANVIPQELIEDARWIASLPVTKIGRFTSRIYRAVADMKAHRKNKIRPVAPMKELGLILIEAAGDPAVMDEIIRAEKMIEVDAVDTAKATIGEILTAPVKRIRNKSKRENTMAFIETVDMLQQRLGRVPERREIIKKIDSPTFGDNECTRQIKRLGWREWI